MLFWVIWSLHCLNVLILVWDFLFCVVEVRVFNFKVAYSCGWVDDLHGVVLSQCLVAGRDVNSTILEDRQKRVNFSLFGESSSVCCIKWVRSDVRLLRCYSNVSHNWNWLLCNARDVWWLGKSLIKLWFGLSNCSLVYNWALLGNSCHVWSFLCYCWVRDRLLFNNWSCVGNWSLINFYSSSGICYWGLLSCHCYIWSRCLLSCNCCICWRYLLCCSDCWVNQWSLLNSCSRIHDRSLLSCNWSVNDRRLLCSNNTDIGDRHLLSGDCCIRERCLLCNNCGVGDRCLLCSYGCILLWSLLDCSNCTVSNRRLLCNNGRVLFRSLFCCNYRGIWRSLLNSSHSHI